MFFVSIGFDLYFGGLKPTTKAMSDANRPWEKFYPPGCPTTIEEPQFPSLSALFKANAEKYASRVAFHNMGVDLTYQQLDEQATHFAAYLQQELGLKKGDRIAIQMPNLLQFPVAFIGALKAGLIVVNTNPLYTASEMEHQFKDAGISAVLIVSNFAYNLEKVLQNLPIKHVIVTKMGDLLGGLKGSIVDFVVKYVKKLVPKYNIPEARSFKEALKKGATLKLEQPQADLDDIAVLQYTGGTTGLSKGAQLSHRNLLAHNEIVCHWFMPKLDKTVPDVVITAIPMYHIFALAVNGLMMHTMGAKNVLITNPRDMPGFVKELSKHRFTIMTGVNTLYNGLLNNPDFKNLDMSSLKISVGGGMAVQEAVSNRWKEVTGANIIEGYGLSETSPVLTCNPLDGNHRIGHIGVPLSSTEIAIMSDDGQTLPQGEAGEICARGPQVMKGYWNHDNEGVFFPGGWFRTGDIGVYDEDGFIKIVDRKKDMIMVSGFNVFPTEIEHVLSLCPKVLEGAAVGVKDKKSEEAVKVFVVKKDDSLTEEELIEHCRQHLTRYKLPSYVEFRDELPKSNVGKILRRLLKED